MSLTAYVMATVLLFGAELLYLRVARHFNIIDVPNERSSHVGRTTVRGGGAVFWLAALIAFVLSDFAFPYFFTGLTLAAAISFRDDLRPVPGQYRIGVQFVAVALLLCETGVFPVGGWLVIPVLMLGVGMLNACNFMDGINGMTAFYSLVTVGTLWYWHAQTLVGITDSLFACIMISLLVFAYFNARQRAVCFAGDVGSIAIAFIILYLLLRLVRQEQTYLPVLLLAVYGVDSVLTIGHRLYIGENIFRAHRLHLFQLLVHTPGWPHLRVSALYASIQLLINGFVLIAVDWPVRQQTALAGAVLGGLTVGYVVVRAHLMNYDGIKKEPTRLSRLSASAGKPLKSLE